MAEFVTCSQNSVVFWDCKSFAVKRSAQPFSGSDYHVASVSWSASNSKVMVAPKWGDCLALCESLSDVSSWTSISSVGGGHFTCGCLMANSRFLLSGSSDGLVMLWDVKNKKATKTLQGHSGPVRAVVNSASDHLVLSGAQDGALLMHAISSSHSLRETVALSQPSSTPEQSITRLRFSVLDKALFGSTSEGGQVSLWSMESQRLLHQFAPTHTGSATDLCFAPGNNKLLISVGQDCKIRFLDIQQRKEVTVVTTPSPLTSVAILRDGYTLVAGGVDGQLYVYELRSMKSPKHTINAHQGAVTCIAEQNAVKSSHRRGSSKGSSHSSKKSFNPQSPAKPSHSPATDPTSMRQVHSEVITPQPTPSALLSQSTQFDSTSSPAVISPLPSNTPHPPPPALHSSHPPLPTHPPLTATDHIDGPPPIVPHSHPSQPLLPQTGTNTTAPGISGAQQRPLATQPLPGTALAEPATPAPPSGGQDSSGVFSPVDTALTTPHPGTKVMAAIQPTQRLPADTRQQEQRAYPLMSTFVSSTPAVQPPLGMSGIFSPLDAATPASLARGGAIGGWSTIRQPPFATPLTAVPVSGGLSSATGSVSRTSAESELPPPPPTTTVTSLPPPPPATSSATRPSTTTAHTHTTATTLPDIPAPSTTAHQSTEGQTLVPVATMAPSEPASSETASAVESTAFLPQQSQFPLDTHPDQDLHVRYLEKLIRDSNEELRYAVHRDVRALGLDMFRQFLIMQQQFGKALTILNEKVERLSEENKHLQEQLHQYMPKY